MRSSSHSQKLQKLPVAIWIGPVNEALRIFRELNLSRAGCTSDCCKSLLWQVFAISLSCSRLVELMLSMIKTLVVIEWFSILLSTIAKGSVLEQRNEF